MSGSNWVGKVDGVQISSSSKNWNAMYYEFCDEIANYNAAFPGYSNNHGVYSSVQIVKNGSTTVNGPSLNFSSSTHGVLYTNNYLNTASFGTSDDRY